jgi:hypothetical protein
MSQEETQSSSPSPVSVSPSYAQALEVTREKSRFSPRLTAMLWTLLAPINRNGLPGFRALYQASGNLFDPNGHPIKSGPHAVTAEIFLSEVHFPTTISPPGVSADDFSAERPRSAAPYGIDL